jgi:hypothetical protein
MVSPVMRPRRVAAAVLVIALCSMLIPLMPGMTSSAGAAVAYEAPPTYTIGLRTPSRITKLIYPTIGNPAIVKKGAEFTIEFDPRQGYYTRPLTNNVSCPDCTNWRVSVATTNDTVNGVTMSLPVVHASKGHSTVWPNLKSPTPPNPMDNRVWLVTVTVPVNLPEHLYDVTVTTNITGYGDVTDLQTNSLSAIDVFSENPNFIQLTDIHVFGPECNYISGNQQERSARQAAWSAGVGYGATYYHKEIQQINKMHPDFCIFTGDYDFGQKYLHQTNGAWGDTTEYEYEQSWFYQETQKLNVPVFIVIGNHDGYNYDTDAGAPVTQDWEINWLRTYGPLYFTFEYNGYKFFAINGMDWTSGQRTLSNYAGIILQPVKYMGDVASNGDTYAAGVDWNRPGARDSDVAGYTGQLGWLRDRLAESTGARARIVCMHHDPWKTDGSGTQWASGTDPIIGSYFDMGNGDGRLAMVRLMKRYDVCLMIHGHDHNDTVSEDNTANGLRWEDGKGHVIEANTTSASFQSAGSSSDYPGYRRVWFSDGGVVTSGNQDFNYQDPKWSWPAYAGTNVGGSTNLGGLSTPAVQFSWNTAPDNTKTDVTCTLTNTYAKPLSGMYMEFPLKYLSGHNYYTATNGTIKYTYDVGTSTRMNYVYSDVGAGQAEGVRVYQAPAADVTAPDGSLMINGGASTTTGTDVTLDLSATDTESGVGGMMVSNSAGFSGATWEDYQATRAWALSAGYGTKTVYVKYRDNAMPANEVTRTATIKYQAPAPPPPVPGSTFYFAEGTCRPGFDPYICIQNPGSADAAIVITYMKGDSRTQAQSLSVPRNSRYTVRVKDVLGEGNDSAHDFSAKVQCTNSQKVIAERPMYFNYQGYTQLNWNGGHDVVGATAPAATWYFAEGTCRPGFDPYICLQNPGSADAAVTVTYMKGNGKTASQKMTVTRNSRSTVKVKDVLGEGNDIAHDFSAKVECTNGQAVIAERPMYFCYNGVWTGGHDVMGATTPASNYYFAEGTCRPGFDPYFCIQNPGGADATIVITYMKGDGKLWPQSLTVPKNSRYTVKVKDVLGEGNDIAHDFSAKVECTNGQTIIAERPMYFNYQGYTQLNWNGGHDVIGATSPKSAFYFAEGTCRPGFDPYICIQNPGSTDASVKITYMKGDGTTKVQTLTVKSNSRSTVKVADTLGAGADKAHDFSAKVECTNGQTIIAERPMYFDYNGWTGGHDVVGYTQ